MGTLTKNKKALFDYEPLREYEAGLKLTGPEVKSAKAGQIQLKGAYISIRQDGAWLRNAYIAPYKPAASVQSEYDAERDRQLLLSKKEIAYLRGKMQEKGLTLVPISVYTKGDLVKISFALARGKKKYEKRESIKKRDIDRRIHAAKRGDVAE